MFIETALYLNWRSGGARYCPGSMVEIASAPLERRILLELEFYKHYVPTERRSELEKPVQNVERILDQSPTKVSLHNSGFRYDVRCPSFLST